MLKIKNYILAATMGMMAASCSDFLEEQVPQGTISGEQNSTPAYAEKQVTAAYAVFASAEDINASFSLWNFDVRSDDAYKGGSTTNDGDVFHMLEVEQGILTTNWNLNDIWCRFYNSLSRVNSAINAIEMCDEYYAQKEQRLAEMYFLRAYTHFQIKRLFKKIPFVTESNLEYDDYAKISNTKYNNDEGWQVIIDDLKEAIKVLAVKKAQPDKGRVTKAAAAALLAKVYLYKAYHQDNESSNEVTSINEADLKMALDYTEQSYYSGYDLEKDIHNNFRPEEQYENGVESIWAIQYSRNDGTKYGNLNWGYGLICPNIANVTDGGCDFYKPSQNLVNAFRTDDKGLPMLDNFNNSDYDKDKDNVDPRLFLTVGMPGFPYMFNEDYMMDKSGNWSRSGGLYGYNVSLKHNVDPALIGQYLIKGSFWASSMNRIVLRYADVLLMRAEAMVQLNKDSKQIIKVINELRLRAASSTQMIKRYPINYGVKFYCKTYDEDKAYTKDELMKIVKMERRLELAMESERFFDLVRWGDAASVLNKYFAGEASKCNIYEKAEFTANKNEYLPLPHEQVSAGKYTQNCGGW